MLISIITITNDNLTNNSFDSTTPFLIIEVNKEVIIEILFIRCSICFSPSIHKDVQLLNQYLLILTKILYLFMWKSIKSINIFTEFSICHPHCTLNVSIDPSNSTVKFVLNSMNSTGKIALGSFTSNLTLNIDPKLRKIDLTDSHCLNISLVRVRI